MSLKIQGRNGEAKKQARERVRINLLGSLQLLEKGMGPLVFESPEHEELQNAYNIIEAVFDEEFDQ